MTADPEYDPEQAVAMPKAVALVLVNLDDSANRLAALVGKLQHDTRSASQRTWTKPASTSCKQKRPQMQTREEHEDMAALSLKPATTCGNWPRAWTQRNTAVPLQCCAMPLTSWA